MGGRFDEAGRGRPWREGTRTMKDLALRLRLSLKSRREKAKVERPLTWDERFRLERFDRH
jgi:hypothetical protein